MDATTLQKIIQDKNERREANALGVAGSIIESIVNYQRTIAEAEAKIVELRKELAALEVEQLDPATVLG